MPEQHTNDITGRLALITGASGGLGAACARKLLMCDCDLALTYSSNQFALEELVAQLRKEYECDKPDAGFRRISIHKADLSSTDEAIRLCEEVRKEHGKGVDILVSNAGYGKRIQNIWDIPIEEFKYTIDLNLTASFVLVKCLVEHMKAQRWGRIILMSSIAAYGAGLNGCHYAASKGGMQGMMKNLSSRLAEHNITVNDVSPAMIGGTGMIPNGQVVPGLEQSIPLGRLGQPDEVGNVVEMFAKTGYMTGQSVVLAGGLNHK